MEKINKCVLCGEEAKKLVVFTQNYYECSNGDCALLGVYTLDEWQKINIAHPDLSEPQQRIAELEKALELCNDDRNNTATYYQISFCVGSKYWLAKARLELQ